MPNRFQLNNFSVLNSKQIKFERVYKNYYLRYVQYVMAAAGRYDSLNATRKNKTKKTVREMCTNKKFLSLHSPKSVHNQIDSILKIWSILPIFARKYQQPFDCSYCYREEKNRKIFKWKLMLSAQFQELDLARSPNYYSENIFRQPFDARFSYNSSHNNSQNREFAMWRQETEIGAKYNTFTESCIKIWSNMVDDLPCEAQIKVHEAMPQYVRARVCV